MLFFPRFEEVTGYDQFVALFALVLIDRCNDLSIGFFDSHLKTVLLFFVNYCYCQFCMSEVLHCM